jgi:hypothetical protein
VKFDADAAWDLVGCTIVGALYVLALTAIGAGGIMLAERVLSSW